jgi:MFS family permease
MGASTLLKTIFLGQLLKNTWQIIKNTWKNLIKIILLTLLAIILTIIFFSLSWGAILSWQIINLSYLFYLRILLNILNFIVLFIIATLAQILVIQQLLLPEQKLKDAIKLAKKYFMPFLCLSIILNLLVVLFTLPIYVGFFLIILKSYILSAVSIVLGIALILFLAVYLIFSPFLLIDRNLSCFEAFKKSLNLAEGNFVNIFIKIFILVLMIVLLNLISIYLLAITYLGIILSAIIIILMIILSFSYLTAIYQNFKKLKNV